MVESTKQDDEMPSSKTIMPSLFLANFIRFIPMLVASLLLMEISSSFNLPEGVVGQARTVSDVVSIFIALLLGFLSVRFDSKALLLLGMVTHTLVALSTPLATSFSVFVVGYGLAGVGFATLQSQSNALVGFYYPVHDRPKKISYLIAALASAYLVFPPIMGRLGDWRLSFQILMLPICLLTLALTYFGLPAVTTSSASSSLSDGVRAVMRNRSAFACIVANMFGCLGNKMMDTFSLLLWREEFQMPLMYVSIVTMGIATAYIFGNLVMGRIITRLGKKRWAVISYFLASVFGIGTFLSPNFILSAIFAYVGLFVLGFRITALSSLTLEQLPKYRGSMMSLFSVSTGIGFACGNALGGMLSLIFDYRHIWVLGLFYLVGGVIVHFLTIDPTTKTQ